MRVTVTLVIVSLITVSLLNINPGILKVILNNISERDSLIINLNYLSLLQEGGPRKEWGRRLTCQRPPSQPSEDWLA